LANADDYERAIRAAETDPKNINSTNRELLDKIKNESSERGRRARRALGIDTSADSWGF